MEVNNEVLSEKCGEKDSIAEAFKRERDTTVLNNGRLNNQVMLLRSQLEEVTAERDVLLGDVAQMKNDFEQERQRLHAQLTAQENAVKNAVESKPYFIGLGKSPNVPPFLRFEGRVRNLEMHKKDVEQIIVHIWATRDEISTKLATGAKLNSIDRRAEKSITFHLNQAHGKALELLAIGAEDGGEEAVASNPALMDDDTIMAMKSAPDYYGPFGFCVDKFVDYDNVTWWVGKGAAQRTGGPGDSMAMSRASTSTNSTAGQSVAGGGAPSPLSFADHLTRFFIEQHANDRVSVLMPSYNAWINGLSAHVSRGALLYAGATGGDLLKRGAVLPSAVAEASYSLLDGCERFKYDADVELFRRIAKGEIAEETFYDQMVMIQKLRFALLARSYARSLETIQQKPDPNLTPSQLIAKHEAESALGVEDVMNVVNDFFPAKPVESFTLLRTALEEDVRTNRAVKGKFNIGKLFASNEYGNQGAFVETVRDQHLDETCMHVAEVADVIAAVGARPTTSSSTASPTPTDLRPPSTSDPSAHKPHTPGGISVKDGEASLIAIRSALCEIDPQKPIEDVNKYLLQLLDVLKAKQQATAGGLASSRRKSSRGGDGSGDVSDTFHLNSMVDCQELSRLSKLVFCKRYGRPHHYGRPGTRDTRPTPTASPTGRRSINASPAAGSS